MANVDVYTPARKGQPCVITRIHRSTALHGATTVDRDYVFAIVHKVNVRGEVLQVRLAGDVAIDRGSWENCRPIDGAFDTAGALRAFPYGCDAWPTLTDARAALRPFASGRTRCSIPDCQIDADPQCTIVTGDVLAVNTRTAHALCRAHFKAVTARTISETQLSAFTRARA